MPFNHSLWCWLRAEEVGTRLKLALTKVTVGMFRCAQGSLAIELDPEYLFAPNVLPQSVLCIAHPHAQLPAWRLQRGRVRTHGDP
jgi:hypothetical protein